MVVLLCLYQLWNVVILISRDFICYILDGIIVSKERLRIIMLPSQTKKRVIPFCNSCHQPFPDYHALAVHISTSKKGHSRGKKWATKYLFLKGKRDAPNRAPKADISQEAKDSRARTLSGVERNTVCVCPQCKQRHQDRIPIEFVNSPEAWRFGKDLSVLCLVHAGRSEPQ